MEPPRVGLAGWVTVAVKLCGALSGGTRLSETTTVTVCVEGDCAMVGRQVNTPLLGLMEAPAGGLSKLKVNDSGGLLGSLARLVASSVSPATMDWLGIAASKGG